jgi:hypothetical protein
MGTERLLLAATVRTLSRPRRCLLTSTLRTVGARLGRSAARLRRVPALLGLCVLAGCATPPRPAALMPAFGMANGDGQPQRWHTSCFRLPLDDAQRPVWATDLLLADRVAAPALHAHAGDISLWRFHRRAARDGAGHQFSVLLYTSDAAYADIHAQFEATPAVQGLKTAGRLDTIIKDCRAAQMRADIEATSDPAWDPAIQRTWPYFIMGVSASWLALIQDLARQTPIDDAKPLDSYAAIDQRISELWGGQGQHAYLHHLSGVYGYKPLRIQTWIQH